MRWYSDFQGQRVRQIVTDAVAAVLIVIWVVLGIVVGLAVASLGAIGRAVADAGTGISGSMDDIGGTLSDIPLVGQGIAAPFAQVSAAGQSLVDTGAALQSFIATGAVLSGLLVALSPIVVTACIWLFLRLPGIRRAQQLRALLDADGRIDLDGYLDLEFRRAGVDRGVVRGVAVRPVEGGAS